VCECIEAGGIFVILEILNRSVMISPWSGHCFSFLLILSIWRDCFHFYYVCGSFRNVVRVCATLLISGGKGSRAGMI